MGLDQAQRPEARPRGHGHRERRALPLRPGGPALRSNTLRLRWNDEQRPVEITDSASGAARTYAYDWTGRRVKYDDPRAARSSSRTSGCRSTRAASPAGSWSKGVASRAAATRRRALPPYRRPRQRRRTLCDRPERWSRRSERVHGLGGADAVPAGAAVSWPAGSGGEHDGDGRARPPPDSRYCYDPAQGTVHSGRHHCPANIYAHARNRSTGTPTRSTTRPPSATRRGTG